MRTISWNMQKLGLLMVFFLLAGYTSTAQNNDLESITEEGRELIDDAEMTKQAFIEEDPSMETLFEEAAGYAIFPNVGAGAYIIGVASGNGVVYADGEIIGMADLKQIDIGFQFGGKAYREVLIFDTQAALQRFKDGNFALSGNASAVVLEEGIGESINFNDGIAIVTMPKAGAMIDISVGGQKFSFDPL